MAACGAKVLHLRAVEYARRYGVPLRVRSSYNDKPGTLVTGSIEEIPVETGDHHRGRARPVRGQDHRRSGCRTRPAWRRGSSARSPTPTSTSTWCCRTSPAPAQTFTDITFTLPEGRRAARGRRAHRRAARDRLRRGRSHDDEVGKVSLVGAGMRNHPGVTATFCEALSQAGHQHRDDEHLGDPDLGDLPGRPARRRGGARCTARSSWAATSGPWCTRGRGDDERARNRGPVLAIVGATGAVGTTMIDIIDARRVRAVVARSGSSPRRARPGKVLRVRGEDVTVAGAGARGVRRRRRRAVRRARRGERAVGADRGRPRRGRRRQLRRVPDGPRRAAGGARGERRAGRATGPRGSSPTPTARRCR